MIDNFHKATGKEENLVLLNLALDLLDIADRHANNLGGMVQDGKDIAVIVDVDMGLEFDWLKKPFYHQMELLNYNYHLVVSWFSKEVIPQEVDLVPSLLADLQSLSLDSK